MRCGRTIAAALMVLGWSVSLASGENPRPVVTGKNFYGGPYNSADRRIADAKPFYYGLRPTTTAMGLQTTVNVPDGGAMLLGGYSSRASGRNEFGTPVIGRLPGAGRPFRNIGYGNSLNPTSAIIKVRIIDLAEEDARILGINR